MLCLLEHGVIANRNLIDDVVFEDVTRRLLENLAQWTHFMRQVSDRFFLGHCLQMSDTEHTIQDATNLLARMGFTPNSRP